MKTTACKRLFGGGVRNPVPTANHSPPADPRRMNFVDQAFELPRSGIHRHTSLDVFAGVVVCNYLWRPLLPVIVASVAPGGVLLYETFAVGHERFGKPTNPDFLLRPGELLEAVRGQLEVREYAYSEEGDPPSAVRQRLCAVRAG